MSIDEVPSEAPPPHGHDFSKLQGLQIVGAAEHDVSEGWHEALKLELEARAARFHQAVDTSVVLSDDGVIRWLGDPVARLAAGPDLLTPRALVLADASLAEGARDIVAARLELWLAANTRRLLGPLLALRSLQEESEPVRQLAEKIADSLGVLEREPLKNQIKALDQNSRAALRRLGVRFGAYYIYVPQSLKPASRALALQLWSVRMSDVSSEESVRSLLPLASAGRTSLPFNPLISKDGYRVAGFRPCGERAVRVDIVERLSDMIRAAFVACSTSDAGRPSNSTFLVSGQMTSLTGCSGEAFASILRSLGYESFEIERSRLANPRTAAEAGAAFAASPDAKTADAAVESGTELATGLEEPAVGGAGAASQDDAAEEQSPDAAKPEPGRANDSPDIAPRSTEAAPLGAEAAPPGAAAAPSQTQAPPSQRQAAPSETEANPSQMEARASKTESAPSEIEAAPSETEVARSETRAAPSETIEATVTAWRLAPRRRPERPKRQIRRSKPATGPLHPKEIGGVEARADFGGRGKGERGQVSGGRDAQRKGPSPEPKRDHFKGGDEKRRGSSAKQNPSGAVGQFESRRPTVVDPTSPFAKLLELRTALEKKGNNR